MFQGGFFSPQLAQTLPPLVFGVLTLSGGWLSLALPETNGYDLPETIAEAEIFPRLDSSFSEVIYRVRFGYICHVICRHSRGAISQLDADSNNATDSKSGDLRT